MIARPFIRRRHAGALAVLAALTACQRLDTRIINERRAAVSAKLERIQELRKALAAIPPETADTLRLGSAPLVMAAYSDEALPTGTVAYEHTLENLRGRHDAAPHYTFRVRYGTLLEECGELLEKGEGGPSTKKVLDSCLNLQYVFVLRTRTMERYEFEGDVVAFDLATGKRIGGFPVEATSAGRTETVTDTKTTRGRSGRRGRPSNSPSKRETVTRSVNADLDELRREIGDEVERRLKQLAPAAQVLD